MPVEEIASAQRPNSVSWFSVMRCCAPHKTDPYGRLVAVVSIGDADVGLAQVRAGLAWHFKRYAK